LWYAYVNRAWAIGLFQLLTIVATFSSAQTEADYRKSGIQETVRSTVSQSAPQRTVIVLIETSPQWSVRRRGL